VNAATEKAYSAYRRACDAAESRALRNRPEHISDFNRRNARIAALKEKYERLLCAEKGRPYVP
jgi:hypothetical protein